MRKVLLKDTNGYKANLHTHTTCSDGKFTPEEIKKLYKDNGYSIVAYTDHEIIIPHNELSDENFLALTGGEFSISIKSENGKKVNIINEKSIHLNFFAKDKDNDNLSIFNEDFVGYKTTKPFISDKLKKIKYKREHTFEYVQDMIDRGNEEGYLVSLNHPRWSLMTGDDYLNLNGLWAMEWCNSCSDLAGAIESIYPIMECASCNKKIYPIVGDDTHSSAQLFGSWTVVKSEDLKYENVINALENGDFYSTTGPEIKEIYLEDDYLYIKCSPVKSFYFMTNLRCGEKLTAKKGEYFTEIKYPFAGFIKKMKDFNCQDEVLVCFELADEGGNQAYTKMFDFNDFI